MTRAAACAAAAALVAALAGCGDDDKGTTDRTTTASTPRLQATTRTSDQTPLVSCLKSNGWSVRPRSAGVLTVFKPGSDERALIRTYDNLHDALDAAHKAGLDLDQVVSRQTIDYVKPGTGQIKIAVETCS